jgi:UDP-N-acetyl-D-mannosaminouronate:lipid I N-acetyl-D-mannosaminouronosyltransferase
LGIHGAGVYCGFNRRGLKTPEQLAIRLDMPPDIVSVNGVNIFIFEKMEKLVNFIDGKRGLLIAINGGKIYKATDITREIINNNIGYIDGVGALYAVKKKGYKNGIVIPGCELWLEIIKRYYHNKSFYFVGAKHDIIIKVVEKLRGEFSGIEIKNYRDGYLSTEKEKKLLVEDILNKRPDVVFVGMGYPKQEFLMQELNNQYPALYQGVGGSFDIYAGALKRAPQWFLDHKMEGTYRAFSDFSYTRMKRWLNDIIFVGKVFFGMYK